MRKCSATLIPPHPHPHPPPPPPLLGCVYLPAAADILMHRVFALIYEPQIALLSLSVFTAYFLFFLRQTSYLFYLFTFIFILDIFSLLFLNHCFLANICPSSVCFLFVCLFVCFLTVDLLPLRCVFNEDFVSTYITYITSFFSW